jgi:hypothetical protein
MKESRGEEKINPPKKIRTNEILYIDEHLNGLIVLGLLFYHLVSSSPRSGFVTPRFAFAGWSVLPFDSSSAWVASASKPRWGAEWNK